MGREAKTRLASLGLIAFTLVQHLSFSQTTIYGKVKDSSKNLYSVSVVLKDSLSKSILTYTYSNKDGEYILNTEKQGAFNLIFASLGYEDLIIPLNISEEQSEIKIDTVLKSQPLDLEEVIINSDPPILVKKDTISIKAKFYAQGNEQTVEDLLKKIPGLHIDTQGSIKIGNQEIEKLMIDGDDFFERGYKLLSKNMPAYPIEEIEILKNYSNNRLLKGIEKSNKVALNLKLDQDFKRVWFGNASTGIGNDGFYQIKSNVMNFGNTNKYYLLANFNNTGYNATGDIEHLIRPFRSNEPASIGNNQNAYSLLNLSPNQLDFKKSRTNFNNAELLSLNAIFNPTETIKIKTIGFFNWDENDFFRNSIAVINANGSNFTNTENYKLRNKTHTAFGRLDFNYNISKTKMIEATTKYNTGQFNDGANLVFNGKSTLEILQHQNTLFDQKISYSNKFKNRSVMLITGRFIDESSPQNYNNNAFFFQDLFPENSNTNNVSQLSNNQMKFIGFNGHLLNREPNDNLLELQLGNELRIDKLNTTFSLLEDDLILEQPIGYQNTTNFQVNDLYFKSKYQIKLKNVELTGKIDFHQLFNQLKNNQTHSKQNAFFVNPSITLDWQPNNKNKIRTSYSYNTTNARILDVYSDYVLVGYRSFVKGTGKFNQLDASRLIFNYQIGNWSDRFFANTFILYSKNHDFFSTNSILEQNYTLTKKIIIQDRELITINSKLDYYLKIISSNLKLNLGFTQSEYKNIVNDSNFRDVLSKNYNYGLELRSGFKGIFNYHVGTNWTATEIQTTSKNSFTNNISFLDLSLMLDKKLDIQVQFEQYYFGNIQTENTYYFLDFDARYWLKQNKLTVGITGKNMFNTELFREFSVSDIGTTSTEYRLLPRFILLKIEYRL